MPIENWFHTTVKGHKHRWGKFIIVSDQNIKYNHRMVQGKKYILKRECETCGQIEYKQYENKLDI
jgi:23S rRNA G2445 N2-methylase RlmL